MAILFLFIHKNAVKSLERMSEILFIFFIIFDKVKSPSTDINSFKKFLCMQPRMGESQIGMEIGSIQDKIRDVRLSASESFDGSVQMVKVKYFPLVRRCKESLMNFEAGIAQNHKATEKTSFLLFPETKKGILNYSTQILEIFKSLRPKSKPKELGHFTDF